MQVEEFIKPELTVIVPVLYFIGIALKRSENVKDKHIPLILTGVGVAMALLYTIAYEGMSGYAIFTGICQGVICAGATVYVNQIYKQTKEE